MKADGRSRAEDRSSRYDPGATFTSRVGSSNGRPPVFAIAFVSVLAGLVAIGIVGQSGAGSASQTGGGVPTAAAVGAAMSPATAGSPYVPRGPMPRPIPTPGRAPIVTSRDDGPIQLQVRRHPETMFIHGDVYAAEVSWVFVNILDSEGRVAGWSSVSVPAGAAPRGDDTPTMRFDVEQALPDRSHGPLWVQAIAYAPGGRVIGVARLGVWWDGSEVIEAEGGDRVEPTMAPVSRARPGVFFPLLDTTWEELRRMDSRPMTEGPER